MRSLKRQEGMNVVPFIDVLLVLLAIIFVISNFIALGKIEINLPSASTTTEIKETKHHITITKDGELFFNDVSISKEAFEEKIKEIKKEDIVIIRSDKKAFYEDFVFVIDTLKTHQIDKISMAVEK